MKHDMNDWYIIHNLGDFFLNFLDGDIVEIGCGKSSLGWGKLAKRYKRNFFRCDIALHKKKGSDYQPENFFHGRSDDFFQDVKLPPIAIGFIDGCHDYKQAKKDFWSLYKVLQNDGIVLMHDTHPPSKRFLARDRGSDSYRLRKDLDRDETVDCFTFVFGGRNHGISMIRKKDLTREYFQL